MKTDVKNYTAFANKLIDVTHLLSSDKTSDRVKGIKKIDSLKNKALKLANLQETTDGLRIKKDKPKKLNPYMKWAIEEGKKLKSLNPNLHMTEISKILGKRWRKWKRLSL